MASQIAAVRRLFARLRLAPMFPVLRQGRGPSALGARFKAPTWEGRGAAQAIAATEAPRSVAWSREQWLALAVLFLAFAIRIHNLAAQSFWGDEAYTALVAGRGVRGIFQEVLTSENHPPLFYLIVLGWMQVAGGSEFALRFLAVVAGLLSVVVASRLGRHLFGPTGGISAAAVFALAPFHVYYSQEARQYPFIGVCVVLVLYLSYRAVQKDRARLWVAYSIVLAVGLYTFYYIAFVPIAIGGWLLVPSSGRRTHVRRFIAATVGAAVLFAPWVPTLLARSATWDSLWSSPLPPLHTLFWTSTTLVLGLGLPAAYTAPAAAMLMLAIAVLLVTGVVVFARQRKARPYVFALLAFTVPLALMIAIATFRPTYNPRHAATAAPGLLLALSAVVTLKSRFRWVVCAILAAASAYGLFNLNTDPAYAREDYRGAVAYIEQGLRPGDTIILNAYWGFTYYYHGSVPATTFPTLPYELDNVARGLSELAEGHKRVWYLRNAGMPTDPEGFVDSQLDRSTRRVDEQYWEALRVTLYELSPTTTFASALFQPAETNFGGRLLLTGYSIEAPTVSSGGQVEIALRWQVVDAPGEDYGVWVGLADERGFSWGRADRRPRDSSFFLSSGWKTGETVTTLHDLPALVGTPPGSYRVEVGVYRLESLRGLDVLDSNRVPTGQAALLSEITVVKPAAPTATDPSLPLQIAEELTSGVSLAAAEVTPLRLGPGATLRATLLWRALGASRGDYLVALTVLASDGAVLAEATSPAGDGRRPASFWEANELVREQRELTLPPGAPPGRTTLAVRLLDPGSRAEVGRANLATVEIDAVQRRFDEPRIAHRLDANLGGQATLLGYAIAPESVEPGSVLKLTLYWKALATFDRSLRVFTHVLDGQSQIRGQQDSIPRGWSYPTTAWVPGEVVEDSYEIQLARDAPPGMYVVEVGMYDPATGLRLAAVSAEGEETGDRVILQELQVVR